jgi:galactokinase
VDDDWFVVFAPTPGAEVCAVAPGRVNLIGDHTDYMGGLVLPMAVDLATTVRATQGGDVVELRSDRLDGEVRLPLPVDRPERVEPSWGRYVAGVLAEADLGPGFGLRGTVSSTVPVGSGLSSSAALEVAVALALGARGEPDEVAALCQRAEQVATGVPCGIMDQLASVAGVEGHALLVDCDSLEVTPVPVPDDVAVWVLHSGQERALAGSAYADRRRQCEAAADLVGFLPGADPDDVEAIDDPVLRSRARHVRSECERVRRFADAISAGDAAAAGAEMWASHASLRDDFEVSTPQLDALVDALRGIPGVHGARLTGAGFGGCVVALARPDADLGDVVGRSWRVRPAAGARLVDP